MSIQNINQGLHPLLNKIEKIIKEELFPIIGIPNETFIKGINNIPENLKAAVMELQKIVHIQQKGIEEFEKNQQNKIIKDIGKLFE